VEDPSAHALRLGADAFLVAPLTRANVLSTSQLLLRLTRMLHEKAEGTVETPDEVALASAPASSGLHDFKRALVMELRRAHRYKTPVCLLIAALDGPPPTLDEAFFDKAQAAMLAALRDIDLVAHLSDGRFLILLPQTGREGGLCVAVRLQHCLGSPSPVDGPTASVGVGFCHPQVTEARVGLTALMKHAQRALVRARELGGNRVEAALPGPSRKDRIFLT
jgi:GGDEF domain-containing protein